MSHKKDTRLITVYYPYKKVKDFYMTVTWDILTAHNVFKIIGLKHLTSFESAHKKMLGNQHPYHPLTSVNNKMLVRDV